MKKSLKLEIEFYQNLGKLFYAIAASDKIVRETEIETLIKLVKSKWLPLDDFEDEFQVDAAHQIETVFDWLNCEGGLHTKSCFNDFRSFKRENESLFNEKRKDLIWRTSSEIANSFAGKNKSELIILAKLKMLLKK